MSRDRSWSESEMTIFCDAETPYWQPDTHWLDDDVPECPHFERDARIAGIIHEIKDKLMNKLLDGCHRLLKKSEPQSSGTEALRLSLDGNSTLWAAMISAQKYGAIYWLNRREARLWRREFQDNQEEADRIQGFLGRDGGQNAIRLFNYAICSVVTAGDWLVTTYESEYITPGRIACTGPRKVSVRRVDFDSPTRSAELALFGVGRQTCWYDLRDFAHLATAWLDPELYGSKHFSHLVHLSPAAKAQVHSHETPGAPGSKLSDKMLYGNLLMSLWTRGVNDHLNGSVSHTYATLKKWMANNLMEYLLQRRSLPQINGDVSLEEPIRPYALAVLAQSLAYEWPASEMEQKLFTRGGDAGSALDVLDHLSGPQLIVQLANNKRWLYSEMMQTLRHRAQAEAYRQVALTLFVNDHEMKPESASESLPYKIDNHVTFWDWRATYRLNLWAAEPVDE